jgi:2-polyprenyl-3-methyl-5-hydroxy-6-metoxy-1,4-benzoquinol methylase
MNLRHRSYQKELLDSDEIPFADIKQNMHELDTINSWLGGHKITINGLKQLIGEQKHIYVCEIGCGGGDNLLALLHWCKKNKIKIQFTGIDIKQSCIDFAMTKKELQKYTKWIVSDFKKVTFDIKPDIIFSSLFCHHFTDEDLIEQVQWLKTNSSAGFFINDLQRHWLAYYSIKILTHLFSKSYLVKNDAPLSVAKGFTKKEWKNILKNAMIRQCKVQWQWAFRYLITYRHERR